MSADSTVGAFEDPIVRADWFPQSPFANRAYVLSEVNFVGQTEGGIRAFWSTNGGQTWSSPSTVVSPTSQFNKSPWANIYEHGRVHVVWYDSFLQDKIMSSWSSDGGMTFSPPQKVADYTPHPAPRLQNQSRPFVCPNAGQRRVWWVDYANNRGQIKTARSDDGNLWTAATVLVPSAGNQLLPYVACKKPGEIDITWHQTVGAGNLADLYHTSSPDGGLSWSEPIRYNDISLDTAAVSDASGGSMLPPSLARVQPSPNQLAQSRALIPGTQVFSVWTGLAGLGNSDVFTAGPASGLLLVAAVLPASRSVAVGVPSTLFVTIINAGAATATHVGIQLLTAVPATFSYQTTDANNLPSGTPNTPVDIPAGGSRTFLIVLTPTAPFPPSDILLGFAGTNTAPVRTLIGVNTFLQSASAAPVEDLIMLTANAGTPGIVDVSPATNTGAFAMASVNVGAGDTLTISADTGDVSLPLTILVCQTAGGACIADPAPSVTLPIAANATPTFSFFGLAMGFIPLDPTLNRIVISARDPGGAVRGRTSVAVRTQ